MACQWINSSSYILSPLPKTLTVSPSDGNISPSGEAGMDGEGSDDGGGVGG